MPTESKPRLTGNRNQCTACGEYFNGAQPFDRHRVGSFGIDRRCLIGEEMFTAGFTRTDAGFWQTESATQRAARRWAEGGKQGAQSEGATTPPDEPQNAAERLKSWVLDGG